MGIEKPAHLTIYPNQCVEHFKGRFTKKIINGLEMQITEYENFLQIVHFVGMPPWDEKCNTIWINYYARGQRDLFEKILSTLKFIK